MIGHLRRRLSGVAVPRLLEALRVSEGRTVVSMLRDLGAIRTVADSFARSGIPWVLVKGWTVVERFYDGHPELRPAGDLDVLVAPSQLGEALHALEECGARPRVRNWRMLGDLGWGQVPVQMASGTALDLHWDLVNRPDLRRLLRVDSAGVLDRAQPLELGGASVFAPEPVDEGAHLLLHHALSGGHRLIWMLDALKVSDSLASDVLLDRIHEWRAGLAIAGFIRRIERVSESARLPSLPWNLWSEMVGATWTRTARTSAMDPVLARQFARSSRIGVRDSMGALLDTALDSAVRRLERHRWVDPRRSRRIEALLEPVDEQASRRAYLAQVLALGRQR